MILTLFALLLPIIESAQGAPPLPFPIFLRAGFSTVLEFDDAPTKVVLGDPNSFHLEKLDKSLVLQTLSPYATTNMFVYFKKREPRLFVVTASEDAEPTYYRKFETPTPPVPQAASPIVPPRNYRRSTNLLTAQFDSQKDYLTVEIVITADATAAIKPNWDLVRLVYNGNAQVPIKLWSERKDVQKDSQVKSRFIFAKPNVPRSLRDVSLLVPIQGSTNPIKLALKEETRGAKR